MKPTKPSRVLVPIDNSKNSWRVIDHAITFAKTTGAEITVLYVVPTIQESEFKSSAINKESMKIAKNIVKRATAYAARKGINFKTIIDHGHAGYCNNHRYQNYDLFCFHTLNCQHGIKTVF